MKYSGVEWIGEIPDNWNIKAIRECLFERNEKNDKLQENTVLSLSAKDGVTLYDGENHSGNKPREDLSGYKIVKENDIVANSMNILSGSVGLSGYNGVVSPVYYIYHIRNSKDNIRYFNYIFQCNEFQKNLRRLGKGILIRETEEGKLNTIRTKVPSYQLSIEKIPYPNESAQKNIVKLLDKKTAEIDSLIEIENQQIEKLKEYKQAVITEAITRGLDKNVPLKDSGVDWIGEIPAKWKCIPNKFLFQNGNGSLRIGPFGSSLRGKTLENGPYKIYNQAHLVSNDFSLNRHFVSNETYEELKSYEVLPDDILFSMMGTIGKCRIMPHGFQKGIMDSHLLKARLNELILPKYYLYVFDKDMSSCVISQLRYLSNGSIMDGLNSTIVKKVYIPLPPIDEQKEIISFLDEKCSEIDKLISIKQKKIENLNEYKKSLIYEYVTGKKEAR